MVLRYTYTTGLPDWQLPMSDECRDGTGSKLGRYMLFRFQFREGLGGISDLAGRFSSIDEAIKEMKNDPPVNDFECWQIYDIETGEITKDE